MPSTCTATEPEEELEILKSLEADFTDDENVGAKINERLANIANKRWGITLPSDKLKALLAKHAKPENCAGIATARVNPEIWDQMNNFRRKADLRVSNIQQTLQKATFGILKACDRLVAQVSKLLFKNIIETTDHDPHEVISSIFIRPKKDGGHRLILNLKGLNQFVTYHHFKMETLQSIVRLVEKNCYMASLDLKDAYYLVAVNPLHRKYLRFIWKNVLYQFTCLPNGLSSCPRKFTKLLKPPLTELHKKGHISASYIDDLYLQGKTYDLCVSNVIDTFIQFDSLGFTIHLEKSVFVPSQRLALLGFVIDSVAMTISLTPEKALKVQEACANLLDKGSMTIREVACVIGKIISSFPGVMHG